MNTTQTHSQNVHIYLESNPNPNSLKFVTNFMLLPEGESYDFPDAESAEHAPLAKELFDLAHVTRVFYMSNFVTVTKSDQAEWAEIQEPIKQHIKQHLEAGKPILTPEALVEKDADEDDETIIKIKSILDEYIRPAVEQDGGAISFHSFQEGTVKVLLQGACSGCPSSTITLKAGIENLLKTMVPEVQGVEAEGV
ncbi:MAG: NifU family protein [Tunicatimonas sp.]|uniref:NifU family protein n=1 Tax=Tunicatimonas sp. TaxID=1940096 RepID=UPI003C770759